MTILAILRTTWDVLNNGRYHDGSKAEFLNEVEAQHNAGPKPSTVLYRLFSESKAAINHKRQSSHPLAASVSGLE